MATTFNLTLAREMLALTHTAQFSEQAELLVKPEVQTFIDKDRVLRKATLGGRLIRNATAITGTNFKSDIECFVARSDGDEVVVAFRGSETAFFDRAGAFKDWVLTDFRANRIAYPPAPGSWPDQRWVHAGFWQAYNLIRGQLLGEVVRRASSPRAARRVFVTGFSMGGALALLAALDIATSVGSIPVELHSFAAPRAGDASLNTLVKDRLAASFLMAFRGDPVVHLPPLGPNFPITFRHPINFNVGGIHVPMGNPAIPEVWQQYQTAHEIVYFKRNGEVKSHYPLGMVALRFNDHDFPPYRDAIDAAVKKLDAATTTRPGSTARHSSAPVAPMLGVMMA